MDAILPRWDDGGKIKSKPPNNCMTHRTDESNNWAVLHHAHLVGWPPCSIHHTQEPILFVFLLFYKYQPATRASRFADRRAWPTPPPSSRRRIQIGRPCSYATTGAAIRACRLTPRIYFPLSSSLCHCHTFGLFCSRLRPAHFARHSFLLVAVEIPPRPRSVLGSCSTCPAFVIIPLSSLSRSSALLFFSVAIPSALNGNGQAVQKDVWCLTKSNCREVLVNRTN